MILEYQWNYILRKTLPHQMNLTETLQIIPSTHMKINWIIILFILSQSVEPLLCWLFYTIINMKVNKTLTEFNILFLVGSDWQFKARIGYDEK